jgi:hypothetical protein
VDVEEFSTPHLIFAPEKWAKKFTRMQKKISRGGHKKITSACKKAAACKAYTEINNGNK